jgi:branched-chain amino acid transport system permease protein
MNGYRTAIVVAVLLAMALPFVVSEFWVFVLMRIAVYGMYALAFNLLLGYGGMLAFGFTAFFGLGAYALGILKVKFGAPVLLAVAAAPIIVSVIGGAVGYFCIRLSGIYFGMLTFAFQMLAYAIFVKAYDFSGGDDGLHGLVAPAALGSPLRLYFFILAVVLLCVWLMWRIVHSPFGLALSAQRNNERKSAAIGINVRLQKWTAFVIASGFAGLAGALAGLANQSVFPDWLDWRASAVPIVMTILGGAQSFFGPLIGAVIYVVLHTFVAGYTEYWALLMGVLIIGIVLVLPTGVVSLRVPRSRHG